MKKNDNYIIKTHTESENLTEFVLTKKPLM